MEALTAALKHFHSKINLIEQLLQKLFNLWKRLGNNLQPALAEHSPRTCPGRSGIALWVLIPSPSNCPVPFN